MIRLRYWYVPIVAVLLAPGLRAEEKPAPPGGQAGAIMVMAFGPVGMGGPANAAKIAFAPDGRRVAIVRGEEVESCVAHSAVGLVVAGVLYTPPSR